MRPTARDLMVARVVRRAQHHLSAPDLHPAVDVRLEDDDLIALIESLPEPAEQGHVLRHDERLEPNYSTQRWCLACHEWVTIITEFSTSCPGMCGAVPCLHGQPPPEPVESTKHGPFFGMPESVHCVRCGERMTPVTPDVCSTTPAQDEHGREEQAAQDVDLQIKQFEEFLERSADDQQHIITAARAEGARAERERMERATDGIESILARNGNYAEAAGARRVLRAIRAIRRAEQDEHGREGTMPKWALREDPIEQARREGRIEGLEKALGAVDRLTVAPNYHSGSYVKSLVQDTIRAEIERLREGP